MAADNCYYQLSIHRDGRYKYFCTDKEFRSIDREGWRAGPEMFLTRDQAYAAYLHWALEHLPESGMWKMEIVEVWIPYNWDQEETEES